MSDWQQTPIPKEGSVIEFMRRVEPYLYEEECKTIRRWNPNFDQQARCDCGHLYHRHFDGYDMGGMEPIGCKYCACFTWRTPGTPDPDEPEIVPPDYEIVLGVHKYHRHDTEWMLFSLTLDGDETRFYVGEVKADKAEMLDEIEKLRGTL